MVVREMTPLVEETLKATFRTRAPDWPRGRVLEEMGVRYDAEG